jgi:hypothetical protein
MRSAIVLWVIACGSSPNGTDVPAAPREPLLGPAFPRIASYRIETTLDADAEAMVVRIPLAIVDAKVGSCFRMRSAVSAHPTPR